MTTQSIDSHQIITICRQNNVAMVGIFRSAARGEATEESDIDLLVRFATRKGFFELVRIERQLSEALGREVDLVTEAALSPYIRDRIMDDLTVIYEAG